MKNLKSKMMRTVLLGSAAGMLVLGGTAAYLTDHAEAVNEFTVGKVDIDLTEPSWKPEDNKKIVPTQDIKKDPKITNTGINDAYVYLQVEIPKSVVITADAAGFRQPQANTELFSYKANPDWTLISAVDGDKAKVYTYSYDKILKPGETTGTLFDTVKFANVIEGQLDTKQVSIPVHAYAIQSQNTGGNATDVPGQAKTAYEKYVNQNTAPKVNAVTPELPEADSAEENGAQTE